MIASFQAKPLKLPKRSHIGDSGAGKADESAGILAFGRHEALLGGTP